MYSELRPDRIVETINHLGQRIEGSFPGSGLGRVTAELGRLAREAGPTAGWLRQPIWPLRIGAAIGILGIVLVMCGGAQLALAIPLRVDGVGELLQASEAAVNEIILLSLAIFFLLSLETRVKRGRALAALHQLRSIVHIVDMHQLTKDPQQLLSPDTTFPPARSYTRVELARYLDFCSELLSLASKLAALHVQYLNDPVVLAAVNDVEALAGGLSNKIWQKIMILDVMTSGTPRLRKRAPRTPGRAHPLRAMAAAEEERSRDALAGVRATVIRRAVVPRSAFRHPLARTTKWGGGPRRSE
ncbi:MAG: hypothetical protein ACK47B_20540 [Armatimonadota bacterium]